MKQRDSIKLRNIFNDLLKENKTSESNGFLLGLSEEEKEEIASNQDLFWPIEHNNLEMAKILIELGVDINKNIFFDSKTEIMSYYYNDSRHKTEYMTVSSSPLYKASYKNQTKLAKFLVENGAKINQLHERQIYYCYDSQTDLDSAIYYDFKETTSLNCFVSHNNLEMVKFLIEKGATLDKYIIKKARDIEMFNLLFSKTLTLDPKLHPNIRLYALEAVVKFNDQKSIEQVIDKIENKEAGFNQLLLFAIQYENPDLAKFALHKQEINLKVKYQNGTVLDSALIESRKINNKEITGLLFEKLVKDN